MNKKCTSCQQFFDCKVDDIDNCHCNQITLAAVSWQKIPKQNIACFCQKCLIKMNKKAIEINERIEKSTTRLFKAVFPNTTNHYDTLFGGAALQLMDEVAFICATRFSRKRMVTVSSDRVDFVQPIPAGTLIELVAKVTTVGHTSLKIQVDIFIEEMYEDKRQKAISGNFTFVAIDDHKKPVAVI